MPFLSTSQLNSLLQQVGGCDGIIGPVLQAVSVVYTLESTRVKTRKDIDAFVRDSQTALSREATAKFAEALKAELKNLNPFDEAFKEGFSQDLVYGLQNGFDPALGGPDSYQLGQQNSFSAFSESDLLQGTVGQFFPLGTGSTAPGGNGSCDSRSMGAFGQAPMLDLNATTQPFRQAAASLAGVGLSLANNPEVMVQMAFGVIERLSGLLADRLKIFDQAIALIDTVMGQLRTLKENDYEFNPKTIVMESKVHVDAATSYISKLLSQVNASGSFQGELIDKVKAEIDAARVALETPGSFPSSDKLIVFVQVNAYLVLLDSLVSLLDKKDTNAIASAENLGQFSASLQSNVKIANHFGGLFSMLKCLLANISGQMDTTMRLNAVIIYLVKMQEWRIALGMYRVLVDVSAQDPTPAIATELTTPFGVALQELEVEVAAASSFLNDASSTEIQDSVRRFNQLAMLKTQSNIAMSSIEAQATITKAVLAEAKADSQTLLNKLTSFAGANESAREAATLIFTALAAAPHLFAIAEAAVNADWEGFFSADILSNSADDALAKMLSAAAQCCDTNAADASSRGGATSLRREATRRSQQGRMTQLDARFVTQTSGQAKADTIREVRLLKQRLKALLALFRLPCFGSAGSLTVFGV